jgi:DNA-directed RNA polymerase specialized sigma24 family protein
MYAHANLDRFKVSSEELAKLGSEFKTEALPILDKLYNTSYRILLNKKFASKIIKQTFFESIDFCNVTKNEADWPSWIYRIWMREIKLFYSYFEKDKKTNFEFIDYYKIDSNISVSIIDENSAQLDLNNLKKILQKLPPVLRVPLIFKEIISCNYETIAELIDVPTGVIATRIYRARKLLFLYLRKDFRLEEGNGKWKQQEPSKKIFELRNSSLLADDELNPEQKIELNGFLNKSVEFEAELHVQREIKNILLNRIPKNVSIHSLSLKIERKADKKFSRTLSG